jgi:hypothetical protein
MVKDKEVEATTEWLDAQKWHTDRTDDTDWHGFFCGVGGAGEDKHTD